nr:helix-turn-helix domain-containing protein [Micromonospora sp. DSM 115978]
MVNDQLYSVEQVAEHLGLHVRTVRNYVRDGRLKATRIGKQYRIARHDLESFTGHPTAGPAPDATHRPRVEASSIVRIDGVSPSAADRLGTLLLAAVKTPHDNDPLRIQTIHDEARARLTFVILGGPAATAEVLHLLDAVLGTENDLFPPDPLPATPKAAAGPEAGRGGTGADGSASNHR